MFIVYKVNSVNTVDTTNVNPPAKIPLNTKAKFNVQANVTTDKSEKEPDRMSFSGNSTLNIDLTNGEIILESLNLKLVPEDSVMNKINKSQIKVKLSSSFPSTGKVDLKTGEMLVSLDLIINAASKPGHVFNEIKMTVPLSGSLDRQSGIIRLSGEATVPPDKDSSPQPITINVIASCDPSTKPNVNNIKHN